MNLEKLINKMVSENYDIEYINLVSRYASNLIKNQVEVIFDVEHFCKLVDCSKFFVLSLMNETNPYYKKIVIPKKSGESRLISIPSDDLKNIQSYILNYILEFVPISDNAKGFKKGLSILENARIHTKKMNVLSIDIRDFFHSISSIKVKDFFLGLGYTNEVSELLTQCTTHMGKLPQGAPTSPYLANIICIELDSKLQRYISDKEIYYTRYADDLTFSSNDNLKLFFFEIIAIIESEGFEINHNKTRIRYSHERQLVTGLVVNNKNPSVPREIKRRLRQEIHYCNKYGVHGHLSQMEKYHSNYKNYLLGMAYYIKMVDEKIGQKFIEEIKAIPWEY
ncbi:retron St85 family RNA-directed DNA polymerase [Paenibacillus polymyxa]